MSGDLVVLCADNPDAPALLEALSVAGEDLRLDSLSDGAALRLLREDGETVLTVEVPLLVQVTGEPERLLGSAAAGVAVPVWWVDVHAVPGRGAAADRVATALAEALRGRVCPTGSG